MTDKREPVEYSLLCEKAFTYFLDNPGASWVELPDFASEGFDVGKLRLLCSKRQGGEPFKLLPLRGSGGKTILFSKLHPMFDAFAYIEGVRRTANSSEVQRVHSDRVRCVCTAIVRMYLKNKGNVVAYSDIAHATSSYKAFIVTLESDGHKLKDTLSLLEQRGVIKPVAKEDRSPEAKPRAVLYKYDIDKVKELLNNQDTSKE